VSKAATSAVWGMFERSEGAARLTINPGQPDQGQNLFKLRKQIAYSSGNFNQQI
jgi:hypothetical protein